MIRQHGGTTATGQVKEQSMDTAFKTLLLAFTLMLAGTAYAGHPGHPGHPGHDRRDYRGPAEFGLPAITHLTRAFRHLGLSEDQRQAIHADLQAMREEIRPLVRQFHASRRALHEQIMAEGFDEEAVAALAAEQGKLTAEITTIVSGTAAAMLAQLTDEQRSELQALAEKRRARHEARMEHRPPGSDQPVPAPED
jgi:Spy/CpxP family protein refolding chaperone